MCDSKDAEGIDRTKMQPGLLMGGVSVVGSLGCGAGRARGSGPGG
jgi:hypothetical protein